MLALFFFFNDTATTEIYTLSLHDALPIRCRASRRWPSSWGRRLMRAGSRRWSALAVMLCAVFLASVDFNIVTIAIPSIQRGLGTNFSEVQLIVAGYALSFAVLLITG